MLKEIESELIDMLKITIKECCVNHEDCCEGHSDCRIMGLINGYSNIYNIGFIEED